MLKVAMRLAKKTKNCYCFEQAKPTDPPSSLYVRHAVLDAAGIDPLKGIFINVKEGVNDDDD